MATNILMPALSPTMTEGTLARWLKKEGDTIRAGDVIAEIETDKATMEVEAVDEGVLGKILVPDGTQGVRVNAPIAVLDDETGAQAAPNDQAGAQAAPHDEAGAQAAPHDEAGAQAAPHDEAGAQAAPMQEAGEVAAPVQGTPAAPPRAAIADGGDGTGAHRNDAARSDSHDTAIGDGERVAASPLARRMAQQAGIDLASLTGTGPNGRIVRVDIEAAQGRVASQEKPATAPVPQTAQMMQPGAAPSAPPRAAAGPITAPGRLEKFNNVKRITARRLTEAKQTVPHFYVSIDMELDALLKLRGELNARAPKEGAESYRLSVNDMLIKACALTLRRVPRVNASFTEDGAFLYDDVDISVAVSIPDGLITPIIRQADRKGIVRISNEAKSLVERARAGKLKPEEFQGGGFSISNMGMYGVRDFAAIINPPQTAILAVAAGEPRPVVRDGQLAIATVMTCTLSVDHRVIDGALAAEFLSALKAVVQDPLGLLL